MIQYHGHLRDLPERYRHLPVIGFVRNPWDWYVSMIMDYRRKQQYVYKILSNSGELGFEATVGRFVTLGDRSEQSNRLLEKLVKAAPITINEGVAGRRKLPGLRSQHFADYPENIGYYSWLFQLMYRTENDHQVHIGRFENLAEETKRLFDLTGTPVTSGIAAYLDRSEVLNSSPRRKDFLGAYTPELEQLVRDKDQFLVDKFDYEFSESNRYP